MTVQIDYYVFLNSPWAYLGSARFTDLVQKHRAAVRVIPMGAAAVFAESGGLPLAKRPKQRQLYRMVELRRWQDFLQVPLNFQPAFFPADEALAGRLVVAAREGDGDPLALAHACMRAVWAEERNIADPETLEEILTETGHDPARLFAAAETPAIVAAHAAGTTEAIAANVFGAPAYVIDGEIFWGQDRLDFVARRLARGQQQGAQG